MVVTNIFIGLYILLLPKKYVNTCSLLTFLELGLYIWLLLI